jgi:anaerobic selenocysteine-containing dehydrogenase
MHAAEGPLPAAGDAVRAPRDGTVRGACPHDCPDTCALETRVVAGRATAVSGAADHPFTAGSLCTKVSRYLDRTYAPDRILHPMRRLGGKGPGAGSWVRVSWEEALDTIAGRFAAICRSDGPQAILPYSYAGTMGLLQYASMDRRFFNRLGASQLERTICSSAGKAGISLTLGAAVGMDPENFDQSRLILIWGSNPVVSNLHAWSRMQQAKRQGARLIAIDPYRSLTAQKCHEHVALRPGTDGALALGLMHVIIGEGLTDDDYIARHTTGFAALREHVAAWTPERVAAICGLEAHTVHALARAYAGTPPAAIRLNYGMQRCRGGGMAARAIACLPALVGAWREPGGGFSLSTGDFYGMNHQALERPDLIQGTPRSINMSAIGDTLLAADPPVKAMFVYNANPAAVAPDSAKVIRGLMRPDLFCVVHDLFLTDSADYADVFLPATSQLEHLDIHKSYGHLYVLLNRPAIAPLGEALPNVEVFRRLAARMGFTEPCFSDTDEMLCRQALQSDAPSMAGISFESLMERGWQRLAIPPRHAPFAEGGFPTPSGQCEFFSLRAQQMGLDPLPCYLPPYESVQSAPQLAARFPLALLSPPHRHALNSSFANLPLFLQAEKSPQLDIHQDDAAARGIRDGDTVRIFNDRGAFLATARPGDRARPGVVVAPSLWWNKLCPGGNNANAVTSQALTDLGHGATFYDCLVQVERLAGDEASVQPPSSGADGSRGGAPCPD